MCFPNKRENACMFPIKPPKKLGNAHMFCIPRDRWLETRTCYFCVSLCFLKTTKSRVLSWDAHRLTGSSPGQQIFQKENAKKKCRTVRWRSWQRQHGGPKMKKPSFACCDLHVLPLQNAKICFTQKITQKMNRCKFGKRTPVKSYESYNLSYKLD